MPVGSGHLISNKACSRFLTANSNSTVYDLNYLVLSFNIQFEIYFKMYVIENGSQAKNNDNNVADKHRSPWSWGVTQ